MSLSKALETPVMHISIVWLSPVPPRPEVAKDGEAQRQDHRADKASTSELRLPPAIFEKELQYIQDLGQMASVCSGSPLREVLADE